MAGDKIAAAKSAATGFLEAVPDAVRVGLVTFADQARVVVRPTVDHQAVAAAISGLKAGGSTALYDAVVLSAAQLAGAEVGTAVVLSDGADEGSRATLGQATEAARRSGAVFDAVAFAGDGSQVGALRTISGATGGTVTDAANAEQLAAAFDDAAASIANRYVVVGTVPAELAGASATVSVSLQVGDTTVSDSAVIPLDAVTPSGEPTENQPAPVPPPGPLASFASNFLWVALAGIFLALAVVLYVAISSSNREAAGGSRMRRSLAVYTMGNRGPTKEDETTVLGDTQVARSAVEFAGKVVARRDLESVVGGRLEAAGLPLKSSEWLLIHVGIMASSGLFFLFLFGFRALPAVLGLAIGFLVPWLYLSAKESKRTKAFLDALPDTLQLIAGSLSAGYSMPQAIDTVVREGRPPISSEFNRALVETRLGVPIEDALDGIAVRMKSKDFSWVVMAIKIQREVGGNLAEVLTTVAATLRERERLRRQVQVLSAEGRLSAWILVGLPVVFAIYLVLVRPDYLAPLVESVLGWLMIGGGLLLLAVGGLWLRKVVRVEV
jgi:tight adherence protein B